MARITTVNPANAEGKTKELLDAVNAKLGRTPNIMKTLAQSPAALESYLNFSGALSGGGLEPALRERIALAVGQANSCDYCLAAHSAIGKMVGLTADEVAAARRAESDNPKYAAALKFARTVVEKRGEITDADFQSIADAGFTQGEIAEVIANVALNIFTNYFNHIAQPDIDFPRVAATA
jgi:uncharacterized peroxidase-related enzyme